MEGQVKRFRRRTLLIVATLLVLASASVVVIVVLNRSGPPGTVPVRPAEGFVVYDQLHYPGVDLTASGTVKSNVVYEDQASKDAIKAGRAPDETAFKAKVEQDNTFRAAPLVIDFEDLYFKGDRSKADARARIAIQLAGWAREVAPNQVIGFYGIDNKSSEDNVDLLKQLDPYVDAYFPTLYTYNDDRTKWKDDLQAAVNRRDAVNPTKPIYPYLWPQYHAKTPKAGQFIPGDYWRFQLDAVRQVANGVQLWSGKKDTTATTQEWLPVTRQFLQSLR